MSDEVSTERDRDQAVRAERDGTLRGDGKHDQCIRYADILIAVNAVALIAFLVLWVFFSIVREGDPGLGAVLPTIIAFPIYILIGLANLVGLVGAVIVAVQCGRPRKAALLFAVSMPPLVAVFWYLSIARST